MISYIIQTSPFGDSISRQLAILLLPNANVPLDTINLVIFQLITVFRQSKRGSVCLFTSSKLLHPLNDLVTLGKNDEISQAVEKNLQLTENASNRNSVIYTTFSLIEAALSLLQVTLETKNASRKFVVRKRHIFDQLCADLSCMQ